MVRAVLIGAAIALAGCGGGSGDKMGPPPGMVAQNVGNIPGPGSCGVRQALAVSEVAGVRLTQTATLTPRAAKALNRYVANVARKEIGNRGGGLVALKVASHYACRTRNSRPGARLSEHALGNAIDISAFILADGSQISVLGWRGPDGDVLRRLHRGACGPFGTVLGPNADLHHQDHFHFDVAEYRSGTYCR
ncbi:MAG: extensin family protein [Silicimonas sp.]|nr:extensin family protein [Silicimonas sp.]